MKRSIFLKIFLPATIILLQASAALAQQDPVAPEAKPNPISEKELISDLLKKVTEEQRLEIISRASIFDPEMTALHQKGKEAVAEIDLVEELKKNCGAHYEYRNHYLNPNVGWPTVTCQYKPSEKELGGSTNKFLCDFKETGKTGELKIKTRKVKYLAFSGIKNSELVPTLLAGYLAKLVGLPSDLYCPAVVKCQNCSSSMPYLLGKSRGAPSDSTYEFRDAMVEHETKLKTVAPNIPRKHPRFAHGISFKEALNISPENPEDARRIAIEREAWILWLNFLVEMDPHSSNQRIACAKAELRDGNQVYCVKPVIYTKDYGQSFFRRFQFDKWKQTSILMGQPDGTCRGGMTFDIFKKERDTKEKQIFMEPVISKEAQELLLSRLSNISDKQWTDLLRIANTERLMQVSPADFLAAVKKKISDMSAVTCKPFDSGTSIMAASPQ